MKMESEIKSVEKLKQYALSDEEIAMRLNKDASLLPNLGQLQKGIEDLVNSVNGELQKLDGKTNDFLNLPFDKQAERLMMIFDFLDKDRKATFLWLQEIASSYNVQLSYFEFDNKFETLKKDQEKYIDQRNYLLDMVNLATALTFNTATKFYDIRSETMKQAMWSLLYQNLSKIEDLDLPKKCKKANIVEKIKKFIECDREKGAECITSEELENYIKKQFDKHYTKLDVIEWLESFVIGSKKSIKVGAFFYDVLYYLGYISKESFSNQETNKEKYDLIKPYLRQLY